MMQLKTLFSIDGPTLISRGLKERAAFDRRKASYGSG